MQHAGRHKFPKSVEVQVVGHVLFNMSAAMVNSLLSTSTLCRAATAVSIKSALSFLEGWITRTFAPAGQTYVAWLESQLDSARDAANLLEVQKSIFTTGVDDVKAVFPTLTAAQIAKLLAQFQPDEYARTWNFQVSFATYR